ncbi:MAG: substrate-binding domain-containing protein [Burkholderiales bacterium]
MQIKILTSNSTLPVLNALIPAYEKNSGNTVSIIADSAKAMVARIRGGETGDILVLGNGAVKELTEASYINGTTRRGFARAIVGVGVRSGTPHPDISSVDAFRKSLLAARAIAHTVHGASGMYIPTLIEKLGITAEMKPKTVTRPGGYIGTVVVAGEADIALQQIPELLAVPGLDCVGPVPDAVQKSFETSIALFRNSTQAAAAQAMADFFANPVNTPLFREKGLEHVTK